MYEHMLIAKEFCQPWMPGQTVQDFKRKPGFACPVTPLDGQEQTLGAITASKLEFDPTEDFFLQIAPMNICA